MKEGDSPTHRSERPQIVWEVALVYLFVIAFWSGAVTLVAC